MFKSLYKFLRSVLGVSSPVYISMFTFSRRKSRVGEDLLGNVYYETRAMNGYDHTRRWVIYKGAPDPKTVPPLWHGWLHHQTDEFPSFGDLENAKIIPKPPSRNEKTCERGTYRAWRP